MAPQAIEPATVPANAENGTSAACAEVVWYSAVMPGMVEAKRRGLQDVDRQRDNEDEHQLPVRPAERCVFGSADDDGVDLARSGNPLRQQPIGCDENACDDQAHAHQHARIHRHAGHVEAHRAAGDEHG